MRRAPFNKMRMAVFPNTALKTNVGPLPFARTGEGDRVDQGLAIGPRYARVRRCRPERRRPAAISYRPRFVGDERTRIGTC